MQTAWLTDALLDLRFGVRTLLRTPGFTFVAILILALGIGLNTAVFSVVHRALLAPLPFDQPGDLYVLYQKTPMSARYSVSFPNFQDWQKQLQTFDSLSACRAEDMVLSADGKAENLHAAMISSGLLSTLELHVTAGRDFGTSDDLLGAGRVLLLDEDFWRDHFGASPAILGRALRVKGSAYTVVGIAPRALHALGRLIGPAKFYIPLGQWDEPSFRDRKVTTGMMVIGRRQRAVLEPTARADFDRITANLAAQFPDADRDIGGTLEGLQQTLVYRIRTTLLVLLGAVFFVWLIACADLANLALVRSAARLPEFATRTALGAGAMRLTRQLLAESILLAVAGGAFGLMLAVFALAYGVRAIPEEIPGAGEAHLDFPVIVCAFALALLAAIVSSAVPALRVFRSDLNLALKDGGRSSSGRGQRAQAALVVVQVSLALVLLAGSGLMIRSIVKLWRSNPGFDPRNLLTFQVMPAPALSDPAAIRSAFRNLTARIEAVSGIESAAILLDPLPLSGHGDVVQLQRPEATPTDAKNKPSALWYFVGPDYFRAMRIPLLRGRLFTAHDDEHAPRVMLIDVDLARSVFGDENPVGKTLDISFLGLTEVVGLVGHVNHWNPGGDPPDRVSNQMYFPDVQLSDQYLKLGITGGFAIAARTRAEPLSLVGAIRDATRTDADQAIYNAQSMEQILDGWLGTRRFLMGLLSLFAALALMLACAGIYGVLSYAVGMRTREIGVRMALGAQRNQVFQLVFGYGGKLVVSGIVIGIALAFALARLIAELLYGVQPDDPLTFIAATSALLFMAAVACFVPARRAIRIDPIIALK